MTTSPQQETTKTLSDALDGLHTAMVGTEDKSGPGPVWKSRPLAVIDSSDGVLRFLVSVDSDWVQALETGGSPTTVTFSDPGKNTYVALQGSARTSEDRELVRTLWNPAAGAYFDSKDDPSARVLEVTVSDGEFWDGPGGKIGAAITLTRAALGKQPGEQGTVQV